MLYAVNTPDGGKCFTSWNETKPYISDPKIKYESFISKDEALRYLKAPETFRGIIPDVKSIECRFIKTISYNKGVVKAVYKTESGEVLCKGLALPQNKHLTYAFTGRYEKDEYGLCFVVTDHMVITFDDILSFLKSGTIKGIGKKTAVKIYNEFKDDSLDVIENEPNKLTKIEGISSKKADNINKEYKRSKNDHLFIGYLNNFGICAKYVPMIKKLLKDTYGTGSFDTFKENPYIICNIPQLSFEEADAIAKKEGVNLSTYDRFIACAMYVLRKNEKSGNTGMEVQDFGRRLLRILGEENFSKKEINKNINRLVKKGIVKVYNLKGEQFVFLSSVVVIEETTAKNILRVLNDKRNTLPYEMPFNITIDDVQEKAVRSALDNPLSIITGSPGTGKTTIIKVINQLYEYLYPKNERIFLAPTGKAARKIEEATGQKAKTAHSFLRLFEGRDDKEDVKINDALVVVDEFSMCDSLLAYHLFNAIRDNCTVVIVGDKDQLPSVGAGAVLSDMIESGIIPTVSLTHIYRQDDTSSIYLNAQKVNNGKGDFIVDNAFHMTQCNSLETAKNEMIEEYLRMVGKYGVENTMCLCPYKENTAGVKQMNKFLQHMVNNNTEYVEGNNECFRVGDPVMYLKNTKDASNGDIGVVTELSENSVNIKINNKDVKIDDFSLITLCYAMSVHKAQGSESDGVIFTLMEDHSAFLYRKIPYVAISRAKKEFSLFCQKEAIAKALNNKGEVKRITLLEYFLKYNSGQFVEV